MSFSTGGLFVNESVAVAQLHPSDGDWKETIKKAMISGTVTLPKAASNRRTLREIANRLSTLTDDEREFLVDEADRPEQEALLWLATCRAYTFVREFAIEVVQERFITYRPDLPLDAFDSFFESKAEWVPDLAEISPTTRRKLRQNLYRMLRESGLISRQNQIRPSYLSSRLQALIVRDNPRDLLLFPGLRS